MCVTKNGTTGTVEKKKSSRPASPVDVHRLQGRKCSPSNQSARPEIIWDPALAVRKICIKNTCASWLWCFLSVCEIAKASSNRVDSTTKGSPYFSPVQLLVSPHFASQLCCCRHSWYWFSYFFCFIMRFPIVLFGSPLLRFLTPQRCLSTRLKPKRRFAATGPDATAIFIPKTPKQPPPKK